MKLNEIAAIVEELVVKVKTLEIKLAALTANAAPQN